MSLLHDVDGSCMIEIFIFKSQLHIKSLQCLLSHGISLSHDKFQIQIKIKVLFVDLNC